MKIAVVGTGYVGLVLGACLAENGNSVACVDKDASKVKTLTAGKMTIYEPGLEEIVRRNVSEERLSFTTELAGSVRSSDIVFIAVGTPQGEDGSADLTHVLDVARAIGQAIEQVHGHRRQEHGSGRNGGEGQGDGRERDDTAVQRRQQPRIPEAGRGGRRLHEARSRRDRRRPGRRTRRRDHARAVRAVHAHRRADHDDGHAPAPSSASTPRTRFSRRASRS